ncbi:MAG: hydroxyphenylacetyl-CoA thioesterase PaaI [Candidatus Eremiobacteraeota bacterium]|nr:hydroxyphenylacetyl-CoA thioesterase PaaI [Candidatus Eremiobacteraeota bacterium]
MAEVEATGADADADALARRVAVAMYGRDVAARALGIEILEVAAGFARVAFTVRPDMLNGHALCHGGFVFALADTAFAYACNGRNDVNVALQCSISFAAPGREGERLEAIARQRARGGRTGTYDVEVSSPAGSPIAYFRGTSYRLNATVL